MFCPYLLQALLRTGYISKSLYLLLGLVMGQDVVFPCLALSHRCRVLCWTELLCQSQNSACSRIRTGAEPTRPWEQWPYTALCPPSGFPCPCLSQCSCSSPKKAAPGAAGSRFPHQAGVPQDFRAASKQSCPVRCVENVQDGHLLALKQSSAFYKVSLAPVLDVYFLKDTGVSWL